LDLAVPRVSHFTEKDDRIDGVGFGLDKVKVFGSVGTGWVKVEDRLGVKGKFWVKRGKGIGSGSGDELIVSEELITNDKGTYADESQELVLGGSESSQGVSLDGSMRDFHDSLVTKLDLLSIVDIHQPILDISTLEQRSTSVSHEDIHLTGLGDGSREEDGGDDEEAESGEEVWTHSARNSQEVGCGRLESLWGRVVWVGDQV